MQNQNFQWAWVRPNFEGKYRENSGILKIVKLVPNPFGNEVNTSYLVLEPLTVCPSVRPSIRPSVRPSVTLFSIKAENKG